MAERVLPAIQVFFNFSVNFDVDGKEAKHGILAFDIEHDEVKLIYKEKVTTMRATGLGGWGDAAVPHRAPTTWLVDDCRRRSSSLSSRSCATRW